MLTFFHHGFPLAFLLCGGRSYNEMSRSKVTAYEKILGNKYLVGQYFNIGTFMKILIRYMYGNCFEKKSCLFHSEKISTIQVDTTC